MSHKHHGILCHWKLSCLLNWWFMLRKKNQRPALLSLLNRLVDSPHKGPVMLKTFPCHNFIMVTQWPTWTIVDDALLENMWPYRLKIYLWWWMGTVIGHSGSLNLLVCTIYWLLYCYMMALITLNTLRPRQNGCHLASFSITFSLKKSLNHDWNVTENCSQGSSLQEAIIGSDNG